MLHSSGGDDRAVRAPRGFRAAEGVRAAWLAPAGPFSRAPKGHTAAQRAGLRYEAQVHEYLEAQFPDLYHPSCWFRYVDDKGVHRWCQPDGFLRLGNLVIIFEVKSRFTSDAWWQLRRLYSSVVLAAFKPSVLGACVVCKTYDPSTHFPEAHELIDDLQGWVVRRQFAQVGVFPWKPL